MLDVYSDYKDKHIFTQLLCKIHKYIQYNFNNNNIMYISLRLLNACNGTKFITQECMINFFVCLWWERWVTIINIIIWHDCDAWNTF